jgi:pyruvate dehydrogenase E1 component alpha subunit
MGTSVARASAEPELYRRASAFRMHGERVDGDDLEAVIEATDRLLRRARENREPAVLEAVTYRYRGHSVADAGLAYRTKEEIVARQANDPLARVRATLREHGTSDDELDAIDREVDERVAGAVAFADASPEPEVSELARSVYAPGSAGQFARMRAGSPFGEEELVFDAGLGS